MSNTDINKKDNHKLKQSPSNLGLKLFCLILIFDF